MAVGLKGLYACLEEVVGHHGFIVMLEDVALKVKTTKAQVDKQVQALNSYGAMPVVVPSRENSIGASEHLDGAYPLVAQASVHQVFEEVDRQSLPEHLVFFEYLSIQGDNC